MEHASTFDLSAQSRDEYEGLGEGEWEEIIEVCLDQSQGASDGMLKQKDVIILRLYLTFMGLDLAEEEEDNKFLQ